MNTPKVSIGMPVYNGAPFIREAIESLLSQTFTDFELVISDNASTDRTEAICREYAEKNQRIRYVRQSENRGATANFQFVLDESVGAYFMWAAADDKAEPNFVRQLYDSISADAELVCVMSDVINISDKGEILYVTSIGNIRLNDVKNNWYKHRSLFFENPTSNIFFCIYGLFKASELKAVQLNYKNMVKYASASEIPLLAQISLRGKIGTIPVALKYYRRQNESVFHVEARNLNCIKKISNKFNVSWILAIMAFEAP